MSQENVEIVREVIEAWNRRDFEAPMSFGDDDVELHLIGGFADMIGDTFDGPDAVLRFRREMAETIGGRIDFDEARDLVDGKGCWSDSPGPGAVLKAVRARRWRPGRFGRSATER